MVVEVGELESSPDWIESRPATNHPGDGTASELVLARLHSLAGLLFCSYFFIRPMAASQPSTTAPTTPRRTSRIRPSPRLSTTFPDKTSEQTKHNPRKK